MLIGYTDDNTTCSGSDLSEEDEQEVTDWYESQL